MGTTPVSEYGLSESSTHAFVVKVWQEENEAVNSRCVAVWRGRITHVMSGHQRYFVDFEGLIAFIRGYLLPKETRSRLLCRVWRRIKGYLL